MAQKLICTKINASFWNSHLFQLCGSRKYPYPHHGRLFDLHPPTPQDFLFQGIFDDPPPPSPQEFPEFLNGVFAYHTLEIQSSLGT